VRPFRNSGWIHYEKLQAIMPTRARGTHAFRPSVTTTPRPPSSDDIGVAEEAGLGEGDSVIDPPLTPTTSGLSASKGEGSTTITEDHMVVDSVVNPPLPLSLNASKRKFLSASDLDDISSISSSDPSKKKRSENSKNSKHKTPIASQRLAAQISQAVAVNNMQGTINCLADVFEKSMATPEEGSVIHRDQAMQLVQEVEDELSAGEKAGLITHFMNNTIAADTYLSLKDPAIRKAWISSMLALD
jgi:hypothetical protein